MFDYRNNIKAILNKTDADDKSLQNSMNAIMAIFKMSGGNLNAEVDQSQANAGLDDKTKRQIQTLLDGIIKLLLTPGDSKAKQTALSALHKLTFNHEIGKNFGKDLGKLDQAIQQSEKTTSVINKKIFEKALEPKKEVKKDYRKGRRYTVIRELIGCELINDSGDHVYSVNEEHCHELNLKTGDIVEALPKDEGKLDNAEVLRVVGFRKLRQRDYDQIDTFKYGVVQGSSGNFAVSRNIKGEKLKINHKQVVVPIDSSYYQNRNIHIEDGSIVDLAWYSGDVRLKRDPSSAVTVRWIYETQQPKRVGKKQRKVKTTNSHESLEKLDMDLHYQRVGIAIGDNQNEAVLEGIVNRYNGIPIAIDAFEGKKKVIENQIKDLDIVILVTAFAAHDSTWNIREFASKYNVKFAVSSSKGYQAFERALYRADQGLPAYEGNQSITYKKV